MPDSSLEDARKAMGYKLIAGVDEAGRGPWAGPVVAGAVVFDLDSVPGELLRQVDDSKKLSAKHRDALFEQICDCSAAYVGVGVSQVEDIDI